MSDTALLYHRRPKTSVAVTLAGASPEVLRGRGLILLHNHPSGNPYPSLEDVRTSRSVVALARMMGARLLDHVITADGARFSFRDEGLI